MAHELPGEDGRRRGNPADIRRKHDEMSCL